MSEQGGGARAVVEASELLTVVRFQEELRQVTRFGLHPPVGDPLDAAVKRIERYPSYSQSRLLARILAALTYQLTLYLRSLLAHNLRVEFALGRSAVSYGLALPVFSHR